MTSRERVLTAIAHHEPDRVPFNLRPDPAIVARLRAEAGDVDFATHFRHDVRYVYLPWQPKPDGVPEREWAPRPTEAEIAQVAAAAHALQAEGVAACSGYAVGVFEQAKHWLGDVETLVGPYEDPLGFGEFLDRITHWKCQVYGAYAAAGVDLVWIGDDLGTQRSLVMSPVQYREWYRPRHRQIVAHLRAIRPEAKIAFHCCGHVTPLIPDLVEIGIDVLEAVQAEAMDVPALKREFGRDIAFWGGVGAQSVLELGTPAQVREGVRQTLQVMAPGGGYIAAPCHTLTEHVSWENVLAFHEAMLAYGAYPNPAHRGG